MKVTFSHDDDGDEIITIEADSQNTIVRKATDEDRAFYKGVYTTIGEAVAEEFRALSSRPTRELLDLEPEEAPKPARRTAKERE